ncbi:hypothetical protein FEI17_09395 [Kosakonia radicincitans]|uniref:hypothetical protein n=1 Tax=Kosakonia radicincitans TaxID=283686 RepID=UPI0011ED0738|nr:hypothetical protein [Kosakonia radicincitans]QEM90847.1 hypothetical protein FEI17_09395 [Kosakonia radicincitans]
MDEWQYSPLWSEEELLNGGYSGFVYMFYFPDSDQVYIGSKQLYKRIKEAKKIKPDSKENDWRDYSSSSNLVNQKIENGERYVRTVLWAFPSMRETLLVESVLITSQILKSNCLNLALMNKIRAPNAANKAHLFGIVQNILEWID